MALLWVLLCGLLCCVQVSGQMEIPEFIYHSNKHLLLAKTATSCYYIQLDNATAADMEHDDLRLMLEHRIMNAIWTNNGVSDKTLEDVRNEFGDLLADFHCLNKNIHKLAMQAETTTAIPTTTAVPTTPAPTTAAPTTAAPTTAAPTTAAPTTAAPTTAAPTTAMPTTHAPTHAPTTHAPTHAPTTHAPTHALTTHAPTTHAPTHAPTTAMPTTTTHGHHDSSHATHDPHHATHATQATHHATHATQATHHATHATHAPRNVRVHSTALVLLDSCNHLPNNFHMAADMAFLLDVSNTVTDQEFQLVKDFIKAMTSHFEIGKHGLQVSVTHYDTQPNLDFNLNQYHNVNDLDHAVDHLHQLHGHQHDQTFTGTALHYVRDYVFKVASGDRPEAPNVLVVISDGPNFVKNDHDELIQQAQLLHGDGVQIIVIGVGEHVHGHQSELAQIANDYASFLHLDDYSWLQHNTNYLTSVICSKVSSHTSTHG